MNSQQQDPVLVIRPRQALYIFGGIGILIVILSFFAQCWHLFPDLIPVKSAFIKTFRGDFISEFDFHGQPNISFYFTMLTLDVSAFFLFVIAHFKKLEMDKYRFQWAALAWIVLLISIDSLALIHDRMREYFDAENAAGWSSLSGIVIGFVVAVVLIINFFRFRGHLEKKYRMLFLAAIFVYFAGALIKTYLTLKFTVLEQTLQYGGATLLLYSILLYMESQISSFSVSTR